MAARRPRREVPAAKGDEVSKRSIPDAVLASHTAILGKTGAGKTSTEKLAIEQVVADGFRVCVLDAVKSDWWGITSSANGKHAGLPFKILGGPRGHVPLHSSAGKVIGQLVGAGKLPLSIIDMADFEAGGLQRFFIDFAPALMRSICGVVYLVIEEAHEFAPKERSGIGAENMAIHWAKKLATAGRSKGIRMIVATQRVQSLHNAVLGSCETLIAHRLTTPADQEPALKWLKANVDKATQEKVSASLSSLPTGTGWVCSGEAKIFEQIKFPKFSTYDNTATPERDGEEADVKTAHVDQDELRAIIGVAVEEAEASDPKLLRKKLAERDARIGLLERQQPASPIAPDPQALAAAEERGRSTGYSRGKMDGYADAVGGVQAEFAAVLNALDGAEESFRSVRRVAAQVADWAKRPPRPAPAPIPARTVTVVPRPASPPMPPSRARINGGADGHLPRGEKACLIAIAQYPNGVRREQLTVLTGYKRSSRDAYLQRLGERGYIDRRADRIVATDEGVDALGSDYQPLPTGRALQEYVMARLPEGERRVLEVLIGAYPDAVDRIAIDAVTGYQRSSRDAYLRRLGARELVTPFGRGAVKASDALFGS
jgi:hypothetical protein